MADSEKRKDRAVLPVGVPGWRRAACLGCDKTVVAARDDYVLVGGTPDGRFLILLGAELQRILTTAGAVPPDEPMFVLGAAHRLCSARARTRIEDGPVVSTEGLPVLTAEFGDRLPLLAYTLHQPVQADMCPFCDETEDLTDEHVWPDWFSRLLVARGAVLSGPDVGNGKINITVPVCRSCNNTWMSVIEKDTRDLLIKMFDAATGKIDPFQLTATEQTQLAKWAVKTAYLIDAYTQPAVPRGYLHEFALHRAPNAAIFVWVAGFTPHSPAVGEKRALDFLGRDGKPTNNSPNAFVVTFTILHVLFQVVGQFNDKAPEMRDNRVQYAPCLFGIWPNQPSITWPPQVGFSEKSWAELHDSIGP